jgi:ADP-ribose pyrophosphatase YjhB (NUDIX family)
VKKLIARVSPLVNTAVQLVGGIAQRYRKVPLTPARQAIADRLEQNASWRNTDEKIKLRMLGLPESWNGMLTDLADRPEVVGGVTQKRIVQFLDTDFGAIIQYEVEGANGNTYNYMYFSWRYGTNSGQKGLIYVRINGEIKHFVVLYGEKFATHKPGWDTIGGFADVSSMPENALKEIREETGAEKLELVELHDLGRFYTDQGMTNNNPGSFVAVVDAEGAELIKQGGPNTDLTELASGAHLMPIAALPKLMMLPTVDSFLIVAASRSVIQGILPASLLAPAPQPENPVPAICPDPSRLVPDAFKE